MLRAFLGSGATRSFNRLVTGLLASPRWRSRIHPRLAVVRYTGRRSGRAVSTPVGYRRGRSPDRDAAELVLIDVMLPDSKTWWRNFTGEGAPLSLDLPEGERTGHATAVRLSSRRALVTARLDPPARDAA